MPERRKQLLCRVLLRPHRKPASVTLDDAVLDRIDQIVPPGVNLNPADAGWQPPSLTDPAARRRPQAARAVG